MKLVQKIGSAMLVVAVMLSLAVPAFAAGEESYGVGIVVDSIVSTDSYIEYTEYREDGEYFVHEDISDDQITTYAYKVEDGKRVLDSTTIGLLNNGAVQCTEVDSNGNTTMYEVRAEIENLTTHDADDEDISPAAMTEEEKYLRTDEYGISLVGKKISVGAAAGAIVLAADYIPTTTATAIIKAALKIIGSGVVAAVSMLPNYLYVTSEVYKKKSVGKTYYRYYNDFYLDANRTEHIGQWTFRHRAGH